MSTTAELISASKSPEEIKDYIGADSLAYLSVDGLIDSIGLNYDAPYRGLCVESFTGDYPAGLYDYEKNYKSHLSDRQKAYIANNKHYFDSEETYMSKAYEQSGVNIHAGYEAVERISSHVERTMRKEVLGGLGGFGATFDLSQLNMKAPVLVSGTDGVGTKLKLAIDHGKHDTIGIDAVAMCVNDILTTGAEPLYFLDYIATNKVVPSIIEQIVKGVSDGCEQTNTALIGGETAEMGEMYHEGEYDIAGFAVGAVEKDEYIDGSKVEAGQAIIGLASNGIHSNGYSLVRKLIKESGINLHDNFNGKTYLETFLAPTELYVKPILELKNM